MFKIHRSFDLSPGVKNNSIAVARIGSLGMILVTYHETVVVEANTKKNRITLRSGGWDTVSTRTVINQALSELGLNSIFLYRKKGVTMLAGAGKDRVFSGTVLLTVTQDNVEDQVGATYSAREVA